MIDPPDRYFDDWSEGEVVETAAHLMTEERIRSFAEEFDPQRFHVDPEAAAASIYGGIIASGWHTGAVLMKLFTTILGPSSLGSPGVDNLRWRAPVRGGDELRLRVSVAEVKASASKPDRGIVVFDQEVLNQHDEVVMSQTATLFLLRRP